MRGIDVGINLLDKITEGRELPEGYDLWAIRSVHPDLRSRNGYRWPFPGNVAKASGPFFAENTSGCPEAKGDGICAATDWEYMASGGIPALSLLLVAVRSADVLGREGQKFRATEMMVVDLLDGARLLREKGKGADLHGADLRGAALYGANLHGADLREADLRGADLYGADLRGAALYRANLHGADLRGASLREANLRGADLRGADLYRADLREADLRGADLRGADLYRADLYGANLHRADLYGARSMELAVLPDGWKVVNGLIVPGNR